MSFFKKFFSNHNGASVLTNSNQTEEKNIQDILIPEELFVDKVGPEQTVNEANNGGITLNVFLEQDFQREGYYDGYTYHSKEIQMLRIKALKASFRQLIDQLIDQREIEILKLKNHGIDIENLSDRLTRQLENNLAEIRRLIERLEKEKELSAIDEGLIMKAIHDYNEGFIRGSEVYQEEKILASSSGLFN